MSQFILIALSKQKEHRMQETNQLFSVPGWENSKKTELKKYQNSLRRIGGSPKIWKPVSLKVLF